MSMGGDCGNLAVRKEDALARQTNFHLCFGFRHKAKGGSQHTREILRSIGLDEVIKRMDGKRIERIFTRCGQKHNQGILALR